MPRPEPHAIDKPPKALARPAAANAEPGGTVIWGAEVEHEDFVKVPRTLFRLGRYDAELAARLKSRHILLLLALAARKFENKPIRAYWEELAEDLGESKNTVRKWAYQLRDSQLLVIRHHRGRDPERNKPGHRNERNSFDIAPFVAAVEKAWRNRCIDRKRRKTAGAA